ncbi:LOW QUALITY PROTEIN: hypothetical protein PanWU01x14_030870 [Parasponia andersonii]|uniref:Uncharacterized protein n=1 Tax=Parasponia andersonii TaxID=3476 RepID=A0A2P5DUV7_PARAD|nr:LOW QUALITY PROTEIN: hypothetical protein PanWU01x14_030870 [Parasponia andersonii]
MRPLVQNLATDLFANVVHLRVGTIGDC